MANTLQDSCLEKPPDGKAWQATVHKVGHDQSDPICIDARLFFLACGSSAPVRVECEGGSAAWLVRILAMPTVQAHGLPPLQELCPHQSLFKPLVAGDQKASLATLSL